MSSAVFVNTFVGGWHFDYVGQIFEEILFLKFQVELHQGK